MRFLIRFFSRLKSDSFEDFIRQQKDDPRKVDWMKPYWAAFKEGSIKSVKGKYKYHCPACGYPTLDERAAYEICMLCSWEDDGQDGRDADQVYGGPNSDYSLSEARQNFDLHGTSYRPSKEQRYLLDSTVQTLIASFVKQYESLRWRGRVPNTETLATDLLIMSEVREFLMIAIVEGQRDPAILADWCERAKEEFKRRRNR